MSREEVLESFDQSDARLEALRARLIAKAEAPLTSGDWRVRDALSHVAARANPVGRLPEWFERIEREGTLSAGDAIHPVNAEQVRTRASMDAAALIDEIIAGHEAARVALKDVDDATLARQLFLGAPLGNVTVAGLLVRAGAGHEANHLSDIEAALDADA